MRRRALASASRALAAAADGLATTSASREPGVSTAAAVAAAAAAVASGGLAVSRCEPPARQPLDAAALAAARAAVNSAWQFIDEALHRDEAALGSLASFLLPQPVPPVVSPAKTGDGRVSVSFPIRGGADPAGVVAAVSAAFGPGGARMTSEKADGGGATTVVLSSASGGVEARVRLVACGEGGSVELTAWPSDLASPSSPAASVLTAGLRSANEVVRSDGPGGGRSFSRSWTRSWSSTDGVRPGDGGPGGPPGGGPGGLLELGDLLLRGSVEELLFRSGGDDDGDDAASRGGAAVSDLERLGCCVTLPSAAGGDDGKAGKSDPWAAFAGYGPQKRAVEEALLPLRHPDLCDGVAAAARAPAVSGGGPDARTGTAGAGGLARPRAVLFSGPPGCGKTTVAAIAAATSSAPLVYVPVEAVVSKYYGEAEQRLAGVFEAARSLATAWVDAGAPPPPPASSDTPPPPPPTTGKALVFIDEVDSLATSRGGDMHEATRRCLGVLLRALDGFASTRGVVAVLATNRPGDVDPALLSRCGARVEFPLPDGAARRGMVGLYAAHLSPAEADRVAAAAAGLSGRAIRDAAEAAERAWAARLLEQAAGRGGSPPKASAPPLEFYLSAIAAQQSEAGVWREQ